MTEEYKKYYQMMYASLDEINPRYWNKYRNKITIDNNSIVMFPTKYGIKVLTKDGKENIYLTLKDLKTFIQKILQNVKEEIK